MGKEYSITPVTVPHVETKYRHICTQIPHPDSVPTLEKLRRLEPTSMRGMPQIVWDRAEDIQVFDKYGNKWLDWSSGVLVTNAGHGVKEVRQAIIDQVNSGLLHNYVFPSEERAELAELLISVAPKGLDKVFLLTTGSEATECAIKLARTHGIKVGGNRKIGIVGYTRGFHGRTLGSQQAGGMAGQKNWIVNEDPRILNAPFPDGYWTEDTSFDSFLKTLSDRGLTGEDIAGVMMETYQGVGPDFAPTDYVKKLRAWCDENNVVLVFDEVQAGFGRTGKFWAFEHYGVEPDIICCGKGISSSLPLSAVIGREALMDQYGPGAMTSTHTGNPVCCAAAVAAISKILREKMTEKRRRARPRPSRRIEEDPSQASDVNRKCQRHRSRRRYADREGWDEGPRSRSRASHHRTLRPTRTPALRSRRSLGADRKDQPAAQHSAGSSGGGDHRPRASDR